MSSCVADNYSAFDRCEEAPIPKTNIKLILKKFDLKNFLKQILFKKKNDKKKFYEKVFLKKNSTKKFQTNKKF